MEARLKANDEELKRMTGPLLQSDSIAGHLGTPVSRDVEIKTLSFPLTPDVTETVKGSNGVAGFVLTGKWITEYAKYIKLVPQYEKTLASYRAQVDIQNQLQAEMTGAMAIKDQKVNILEDMNASYSQQADLYKKIANESDTKWYEKVLHKIAFPVGLAIGIIVGVEIAD